ncbi:MAG: sensor histidine kinase [Gaiellaceae bacterium]
MTASVPVAAARPVQEVLRDPVLVVPLVVVAGLAVGALGVHAGVSGTRIATDMGLAWALTAAALVMAERPRQRRVRLLLGAAALALLGGDLEWASAHTLWTAGLVLEQVWIAFLAALLLAFPQGRAGSSLTRWVVAGTFAVTLGGQSLGALVEPDARDLLSVAPNQPVAHAVDRAQEIAGVALALVVLLLVLRRLRTLRGAALRSQGPLLAAATVTVPVGLAWLGAVIAGDASRSRIETIARATLVSVPVGVVAGVLWSRLRRPEASKLVVELRGQTAATMGERLAEALGDHTLELAYRLGPGLYVDAAGRPVELPRDPSRAVTAVTAGGEEVAALIHDPALLDEPGLVESVRATAALVLELERLAAKVRSQLTEVRASRERIVSAADAERRRIERNLHDGAQQRLVALSIALGLEASRADPAAADVLSRAQDEVEQTIAEVRDLARGIHPTLLRDEGLQTAVEALARRASIPVKVHGAVHDRLPDSIALAAYFVVSEALTNVVKHASPSEASVVLDHAARVLRVTVTDDGVGGARLREGSGLAGLRDRLDALGATLAIESEPGQGTIVRAELPCES